jgi:hypothetical protein
MNLLFRLCCLAAVGLCAACENPVETRANLLPPAADAKAAVDGAADATATDASGDTTATAATCGCLQKGMWFRFDTLAVTSVDLNPDANVIAALNPLWASDIEKQELNFYVEVQDVTADNVKLRVVNGARISGTKPADAKTCLLQYTAGVVDHPRKGCTWEKSAPTKMNVYAGTPENTKNCLPVGEVKHVIPVRAAVLEAVISADCQKLTNGIVSTGALAESSLKSTCTCLAVGSQLAEDVCKWPDAKFEDKNNKGACAGCNEGFQNLKSLLQDFNGGDLEYKCKSDDGSKAVCLTAKYTAVRIAAPPPDCKP